MEGASIDTATVAMLALAGSVAAGYFVIGLVVAPRMRMPSASPRVVRLVRAAAILFFLGCGMTHVHIIVHTLGVGGFVRPVEGHDLLFHLAQAIGAWIFIVGAALKLELHVVPSERTTKQRDLARAKLREQQAISAALQRRATKASALATISEQALVQRDPTAFAREAAKVVDTALPDRRVTLTGAGQAPEASRADGQLLRIQTSDDDDDSDEEFLSSVNNVVVTAVRRLQLEDELRDRSLHDALTGLANRSLFTEQLDLAWADHQRHGRGLAVLAIDLDGFKTVNDRYGHLAGDQLLIATAHRMQRCVRDSDTLARLGGDEFAIILPDASLDDAQALADRLEREVAAPLVVADDTHRITASIGIADVAQRQQAPADLLREADTAMYAAKADGKAHHETYAPGHEQATSHVMLSPVVAEDAIAWADYMRTLRREIADRKTTGHISSHSRAPEGIRHTFDQVLAAIDKLTDDAAGAAALVLPPQRQLEEFVFHQTAVQHWADTLVLNGILTTSRTAPAERFWALLERQAQATPARTP